MYMYIYVSYMCIYIYIYGYMGQHISFHLKPFRHACLFIKLPRYWLIVE